VIGFDTNFKGRLRNTSTRMNTITIQVELPDELVARGRACVEAGLARDFNQLLAMALRHFLATHIEGGTEALVMQDVQWGLHGTE
jgi:hypothetical protein